jgi:N-methylhydantoinase B
MFRDVTITHQKGSILYAEFPDAVNIRASTPYRLFDALTGALIKARPDLMPAATGGTMMPFAFAEPSADGASRKVEVIEPLRCGMGAFDGRDGVDARDNSLNNMRNHPVELVEANSTVMVLDYDIRPDSGGPGKFRGGVGQMMKIEALRDDGVIVGRGMERLRFQPFGVSGGKPGAVLRAIFNQGNPGERELGKIHELKMAKGDTLTLLMPGGGGFGNPFERDADAVLLDVRNGFVSIEGARRDYGVAIVNDAIDAEATAKLRANGKGSNQPFDFGRDRAAWDAVFDDASMLELNRRLYALPKSRRQAIRRTFFETVVPELTVDGSSSLAEALVDRDRVRLKMRAEMDRLLPIAAQV